MSLEEQRKELTEKKDEELNKSLGPIEIHKGFWFKYEDKTFVFKGLKGGST